MTTAQGAVDEALGQVEKARKRLSKVNSKQVTQADEINYLKAVAYAWFNSHRPILRDRLPEPSLQSIDRHYKKVLDSTAKNAARTTYLEALKAAKEALADVRGAVLLSQHSSIAAEKSAAPPDFSPLARDPEMQAILVERWNECQKCLKARAYLAATVMMGGLLEALFVARANQMGNKSPLFKAKATPGDKNTNNPIPLPEWTLRPYIDVGFEIGWITRSGKDVAAVLRDYRNYVHPEKQRSHGVKLGEQDAVMFWDVTRNLTLQLLTLQGVS